MKIKHYIQLSLVPVLLTTPLPLLAGDLNSPAAPTDTNSAMYTIEDICNRLDDGTAGAESTFQEPTAAPADSSTCTINDVMSKAPVVDDTDGAATTDVLNGKKYWGLKSGEWGLQTGSAPPAPVHATGSTGVAWPNPRFTDNNDGTITDNLTGLIWLKDASCADLAGTNAGGKADWDTAKTAASSLADGTCGLSDGSSAGDWRLPSVNELRSLINYGYYKPALSNAAGTAQWTDGDAFSGVQTRGYWSSTFYAIDTSYAWYVGLDDGGVHANGKKFTSYVWPVRGGK